MGWATKYKARTKDFPVLLRTRKLADSTSQYYFVRQSLQQSASQYYFVQSLEESTSQCGFVLQSLHKVVQNRNFTWVFDDGTSFRAKGLPRRLENRNFSTVFDHRTSFHAKRLRPNIENRNFTSFCRSNLISCEKVACRGGSLAPPCALRET